MKTTTAAAFESFSLLSHFGSVEKWENAVNSEFVQTPSVNTESVQIDSLYVVLSGQ